MKTSKTKLAVMMISLAIGWALLFAGCLSEEQYTVTFDANGGTGTAPAAQTVNAGDSISLPGAGGLVRTGYTFGGWNTNASGTGIGYAAGSSYTVIGVITLYAKWNASGAGTGTGTTPWSGATVTSLTNEAVWYDGNVDVGKQQWFKFTATTADNQSIHIRFGNLTNLNIQVYTSTGATVGNTTRLYTPYGNSFISRDVTYGQEYYIKIAPYSSSYSGSFKIAFNKQNEPPLYIVGTPITLTQEAVWYDGNVGVNEEQWFKFTASSTENQSIHIRFGTLTNLNIQVYTSTGATVGNTTRLYTPYGNSFISRDVTYGQEYYIKITPYSSSYNGSFKITFNKQNQPPLYIVGTPTTLTATTWSNGIVGVNEEQWFKFTATTGIQYIHIQFGTLTNLNIQVYASTGATVGNTTRLYTPYGSSYISRDVTNGQVYYVKVEPYSSSNNGSFKIAFNTSATAPN